MKAVIFFKHLGRLLFLNALLKPVWVFGVDRQVQNLTGPEVYGVYFSLLNLSLVFAFVTDAGFGALVARQLASGAALNIKQLLRIKVALALLYAVLVLGTGWMAGVAQWPVLLLVCALQIALSFFTFLRSVVTGHQLFGVDGWLSVVDKGLMIAILLPLVYHPLFQKSITLLFFLQVQLACTLVATGCAALVIYRNGLLTPDAPLQKARALWRAVAPFAFIILAMATHNRLDAFLLERWHPNGAYEAGVYAAAYRLLDAGNMVGYLVASFLVPFAARHQPAKPLLHQTLLTARFGLLLAGGSLALLCVWYAPALQALLYPTATRDTATVLQWCLPVLPAYFLLHLYGSLLTAWGQLRPFIGIVLLAVCVNTVLNIILVPRYGAVGCCFAALASQYGCAAGVYVFTVRRFGLAHAGVQWLGLSGALVLLGLLYYYGAQTGWPLYWSLGAGAAVLMLVLFAYLSFGNRFFRLSS